MTIDTVRANTALARLIKHSSDKVSVPITGGHSSTTVVPLLSKAKPCMPGDEDDVVRITKDVQKCSEKPSPPNENLFSFCMAYSMARFANSLIKAIKGQPVLEYAYVRCDLYSDLTYLTTLVEIGPQGTQRIQEFPSLTGYEECLMQNAYAALKEDIYLGERYATGEDKKIAKEKAKVECLNVGSA